MHFVDWLIVLCPLAIMLAVTLKAQKYVKSVADFLSASRVAGRYVVAVAGGEAAMGLISMAAIFEVYYNSGFAYSFWEQLTIAFGIVFTLTGYCTYRFRETRAMTMGQFLEIRYSRGLRVFAAVLQACSGILNYAIFPAVGARFLIYFCDLPLYIEVAGMAVPMFGLLMALFLSLAVVIVTLGGQITIMVSDCIQGILNYPLYALVVFYLLTQFSWSGEMAPALLDRAPGESMLNPFDISKLRTFNLFYVLVGIVSMFVNRMSWAGTQGYQTAALNPHEQKMAGVLGMWRVGFSQMMIILLAVVAYTFLNHAKFSVEAEVCRRDLARKVVYDVAGATRDENISANMRRLMADDFELKTINPQFEQTDKTSREPIHDAVRDVIASENPAMAQSFSAIFGQMRVPMALRHILPVGIMGVFCALCIFLMISTDTTYMHSWGSIIVQDIILPLRGGHPLTPRRQLLLLRLSITGVAVFAFFFSFFFAQIDFIMMFFMITGALWAGSGAAITGGLYWSRGTTAGAFASIISGAVIALGGFVSQKLWVPTIYPWLESSGCLPLVRTVIEGMSGPFEPFIIWRVVPEAFPINSREIYLFVLLVSIGLYVAISLLTGNRKFNMERMLHRGKYTRPGERMFAREKLTLRNVVRKMVGIDPEYTRGDKVIAWSVFFWMFAWGLGSFLVLVVWNMFASWPDAWWVGWFKLQRLILPGIIAVISTVWFTIGGTVDLRRLFKRLAEKEDNDLDDGRVIGHVSADDIALVENVEHTTFEEAHRAEHELDDALRQEKQKD